jgi:hypothetical protein
MWAELLKPLERSLAALTGRVCSSRGTGAGFFRIGPWLNGDEIYGT